MIEENTNWAKTVKVRLNFFSSYKFLYSIVNKTFCNLEVNWTKILLAICTGISLPINTTTIRHLYNIVSCVYRNHGEILNKQTITSIYWECFTKSFNQLNKCTWRTLWKCGTCNSWKKINWIRLINTWIDTPRAKARSLYYFHYNICC